MADRKLIIATLDEPVVRMSRPLDALRVGTTKSLNAVLLERLREDLLSGIYQPGSKLKIPDICDRYQVSPGAAREALSRLVPDGLVDFIDQRGFRVPPLSEFDVVDITRVRLLIEREALVDAIRHGDDAWEATILATQHRLMRCNRDPEAPTADRNREWTVRHKEFHQALIGACTSPSLVRLHNSFYDQTERFRFISAQAAADCHAARNVHQEHGDIVDAVLERNEAQAVLLMEQHLFRTASLVIDALRVLAKRKAG